MSKGYNSIQGVLFVNSLDLTDKLKIAQALSGLQNLTLDDNPAILPIPADAPMELPRIILRSNDGLFSLSISPMRIDLTYASKTNEDGFPIEDSTIEGKFSIILGEIAEVLINKLSASIPRIALVVNVVVSLTESSKDFLFKKFIKDDVLESPYEMQLNFLMKKEIDKYKVNQWLRINTLRNQKNLDDDSALLFILDTNSVQEVNYNYDKTLVKNFVKQLFALSEKEINRYVKDGSKK